MISKTSLSVLSSLLIILAIWYKKSNDDMLHERLRTVLDGLLRAERKITTETRPKVGVGFGGCADAFLPAIQAFESLQLAPSNNRTHHHMVTNGSSLEELFNYFLFHGAAAERYTNNATFFKEILSMVKQTKEARWAVGGNAPVMANRLALEGASVLIGAHSTPYIKFSDHVKGIGEQVEDDVHVIFEYDKGESWGEIVTPRANRLIVHNDKYNPLLTMIEEYQKQLAQFQPKLFVLGGLQMMDNFPYETGVREERISALSKFLSDIPKSTLIHFEMASFTETSLLQLLVNQVIPHSDSLGMNEQELPNILAALRGEPVKLVADSNPRVAAALDDIRALFTAADRLKGVRRLTRIHVHTLAFQAIVTVKGSDWRNTMSAAAKASLVANRHVCGNKWINIENARLILDESFAASRNEGSVRISVQDDRPVSCWEEEDMLFCVAPNLVCTEIYQTAGGGDNISAAGLSLQIID